MPALTEALTHDHLHCDELFVAAEEAASVAQWDLAADAFERFAEALEAHFGAEETVLFPAFEARSGMIGGPTQVMRAEHAQMRQSLATLRAALARRGVQAFLGEAESLLILMQQHNIKEENVLYPMADRVLAADADALLARMELGGTVTP